MKVTRILIVDDSAFMRMALKDIVVKNGMEVVGEATTGLEAIEKYKQLQPDIVTMDNTMKDMDGITALNEIRAIHPESKIIVCSAMGQRFMVEDARKAGAMDYIVKPFQPDRVIGAIQRALG